MINNTIYRRYQNSPQSIETTLRLIQDLLQDRINPSYRRILVQATNSGRVGFCITVFPSDNSNYRILTHSMNLRQWRPSDNDESFNQEIVNIERVIEELRRIILNDIIS